MRGRRGVGSEKAIQESRIKRDSGGRGPYVCGGLGKKELSGQ